MKTAFWRLDSQNQTFILQMKEEKMPSILYWGGLLPEKTDFGTLAKLNKVDLLKGGLDNVVDISICPSSLQGFYGNLGVIIFDEHKQHLTPNFRFKKATFVKDELIELCFSDDKKELEYHSFFKMHQNSQIIECQSSLSSKKKIYVDWLAAPVINLPLNAQNLIDFSGRWCAEFALNHYKFKPGIMLRDVKIGRSGHDAFSGLVALENDANYNQGQVFGFHYAFSGGHKMIAEELSDGRHQIQFGHASEHQPKLVNQFKTASLLITHSDKGINGCATSFQRHVRKNVLRRPKKSQYPPTKRPIHYNCWEAIYFNHDEKTLFALAESAAKLGVERFVLDDGWFGNRNDDNSSLGDWHVNTKKYPKGLQPLIEHVKKLKMTFGLWFEPEMVNPDSELFKKNPHWVLGPETQITARNQLVLNLSLFEVREYLYNAVAKLLKIYDIEYIKWDHNRVLPMVDSSQTEGLYMLLEKIKTAFPSVEIESCAAGGGRIDYGMLKFTERFWMSDNNDAQDRVKIQHNAALFLPSMVTGSHVGPKKSHSTGRILDMNFRLWVAAQRHIGFELDLREITEKEKAEIKQVTSWWKKNRSWLMEADILKLDTYDDNLLVEEHLSEDKKIFTVFANRLGSVKQTATKNLKLVNLDADKKYQINLVNQNTAYLPVRTNLDLKNETLNVSGASLMKNGINLPILAPNTVLVIYGKQVS